MTWGMNSINLAVSEKMSCTNLLAVDKSLERPFTRKSFDTDSFFFFFFYVFKLFKFKR